MTRYLYVQWNGAKPYLGGGGEHTHQIVRRLNEMGDTAVVFTAVPPSEPLRHPFDDECGYATRRVHSLMGAGGGWRRPWTRLRMLGELISAAREVDAECIVVGSYMPLGNLYAALAAQVLRIPLVAVVHGEEVAGNSGSAVGRALIRLSYARARRVICVSHNTARLVAGLGVAERRIAVVLNGTDPEASRLPRRVSPRVKSAMSDGVPVILSVTRLEDRKGVDKVIEAMPRVLARFPEARYVVVGGGPDEWRVQELARNSPARDSITLLGRLSDEEVRACYSGCDVFALPSRAGDAHGEVEGFGLVFLEAGAFSKPVVGGRSGGQTDAVEDGVSGLLVDPTDADQVADAIIRLLADPAEARRMGANGMRRVEDELNWDRVARRFRAELQRALGLFEGEAGQ